MRVLGIDPGSRITGFGVVELRNGRLCYVTSGCIKMSNQDLPDRLKTIFESLSEVIDSTQPDFMAIEEVFVSRNIRSALILGQARGAAISAGVYRGLPVDEYTALQIKKSVVGYGHAEKEQVQQMVRPSWRLMEHRRKTLQMHWPVPFVTATPCSISSA